MRNLIVAAALGVLLASPGVAETRTKIVRADGSMVVSADSEAARIVTDCSARKFETIAEFNRDGERHLTKIKLCSAVGEDDATWLKSLQDAKTKIAGNADLSEESKTKIVAELEAEIAKMQVGK